MRAGLIKTGLVAAIVWIPIVSAEQEIKSGKYKASVVELYTSEGCSSCPPADSFLSRLGQTETAERIIPLAFHVDYWDYIGWKDPYARAEYTERQRAVARANRQASIYTPEFVVDGAEARGSQSIVDKIGVAHISPAEANITLRLSDIDAGKLNASVNIDALSYEGDDISEVYLAVYENNLSTQINAGENSGRMLGHDYVVRYVSPAQPVISGQIHHFELSLNSDWKVSQLGVAAVVRLQRSGKTLQAVKSML